MNSWYLLSGILLNLPVIMSFFANYPGLARPLFRNGMVEQRSFQDYEIDSSSGFGVVLLAGGQGKRMKSSIPKQFLSILGQSVLLRSLQVFQSIANVTSIVIVLDKSYRQDYQHILERDSRILWADPGKERQDSVYNGLMKIPEHCKLVAIHDAARPLVTQHEILSCVKDAFTYGAAVLGVPMKATVKESFDGVFVQRTVPRRTLWEIHTPQIAWKKTFLEGFERVRKEQLEVTDDVSVIEAMGLPVKLTLGEYTNIKLTTPEDIRLAEVILSERAQSESEAIEQRKKNPEESIQKKSSKKVTSATATVVTTRTRLSADTKTTTTTTSTTVLA